jgi:plastocyanin
MKRLLVVLSVAAALVCGAIAVPALAATTTVKVGPKQRFSTGSLSIKRGVTVRFQWTGKLPHNVIITKGPQKGTISKVRSKGVVSRRFTKSGRYTIVCQIHPGMVLKLRVA